MKQAKIIITVALMLELALVLFPKKQGEITFFSKGFNKVYQLKNIGEKELAHYSLKYKNLKGQQRFNRGENYSISSFLNLPE